MSDNEQHQNNQRKNSCKLIENDSLREDPLKCLKQNFLSKWSVKNCDLN